MAKRMTEDELKALTDQELRQAVGYMGGKLAGLRLRNLMYYEGDARGDMAPPAIEGRSKVVVPVVRNTVESILPELMQKFAASENVVELEATKQADEEAAKVAGDYLNYLFYKKNNGHNIIQTAFKDALISKVGIVKVWWDNRTEETREDYKGLSDVELSLLMDDEEIEITEHSTRPDEEDEEHRQQAIEHLTQQLQGATQAAQQGDQQAMQAAQGIQAQLIHIQSQPPVMLHDVTCKRSKTGGKVSIECVPPEEFLISRKAKNIKDAHFVGHRVRRTQSELQSMGYKNVEDISSDDNAQQYNMEYIERASFDDEIPYMSTDDVSSADPSSRLIWLTECYIRCDFDGDGIAELRKVVRAGNEILENEIVDVIPFAYVTPIVMPHRFFGLCPADLAIESQRIETSLMRATLDNMYLAVNGRTFAVEGQVNLDDLLTSRPGGVVRVKTRGAVGMLDQGSGDLNGSMALMQYMDTFTERATGWNPVSQMNPSADTLNVTATQANIVQNKADMRTELICRNMAEGVVDIFKLIMKLVCQNQNTDSQVKLNGKWVTVDPTEWRNQFEFVINIGLGTGSKDQQIAHLNMLIQHQLGGLQLGITTPANIYNSNKKMAEALGFKNSDAFYTDPATQQQKQQQPSPDMLKMQADQQKAKAQMQLEAEKHQAEMQQRQAELQQEAAIREREIQLEAQKQQMQAEADMRERQHKASLDAQLEAQRMEFEQWKVQMQTETQILLAQIAAGSKLDAAAMSAMSRADADLGAQL